MSCNCGQIHNAHKSGKGLSRREMVMGLATGSLLLVGGCATNAETGRSQLLLVDDAQLVSLSATAWTDLKQKTPRVTNTKIINRVKNIGQRIAAVSNIKDAQWEYEVFDDATVNAFVLPGGKVGVYKGLIDLVENDDQLACVIGHETGHVSGRHSAERMSQSVAAQLGVGIAQVGLTKSKLSAGAQQDAMQALGLGVQYGVLMPFSRAQESEADIIGLRYMKNAGYDPRQSIRLWERMGAANQNKPPEFLSTHPSETTRIKRLTEELQKMGYNV